MLVGRFNCRVFPAAETHIHSQHSNLEPLHGNPSLARNSHHGGMAHAAFLAAAALFLCLLLLEAGLELAREPRKRLSGESHRNRRSWLHVAARIKKGIVTAAGTASLACRMKYLR